MTRTALKDRNLPDYTRGEERFNMVTHIVGGGIGVVVLVLCVVFSAIRRDAWAVVGSAIYGASMIALYSISSVYHALNPGMGKKVMQVLDHCTIYFLIAGTYTPILFIAIRPVYPVTAWLVFAAEWGLTALAATLTAIDLRKFRVFSMICYLGMGWCIIFALKATIECVPLSGLLWLLAGGISYTVGAICYGFGKKLRYMHSVFHIFVDLGSLFQFFCIFFYLIL